MEHMISRMLMSYEQGKLSRRQLIQGLATLTAVTEAAGGAGSTFKGMALNHIAIRSTNVQRPYLVTSFPQQQRVAKTPRVLLPPLSVRKDGYHGVIGLGEVDMALTIQ